MGSSLRTKNEAFDKFCNFEKSVTQTTTTTTTVYFNEVVFPSVLGLTSPMAFPQHSPLPWPVPSIFPTKSLLSHIFSQHLTIYLPSLIQLSFIFPADETTLYILQRAFHSAAPCMNPLYTLCVSNGVHTNTLQANTAWVLHITYNLCCTCTKGFTHHFGFVFIYFEAIILKALIPFPQLFFQLFFKLSYKYQVISIQHLPG